MQTTKTLTLLTETESDMVSAQKRLAQILKNQNKGIVLLLLLTCLFSLGAYGAYSGWFQGLFSTRTHTVVAVEAETLLSPYEQEELLLKNTQSSEVETVIDIEEILSGVGHQAKHVTGTRSDTGALDDLEDAKEHVVQLIGQEKAVYYIRDQFYPVSNIGERAYYSILVDQSFLFDERGVLEAVCQGKVTDSREGFCKQLRNYHQGKTLHFFDAVTYWYIVFGIYETRYLQDKP